MRFTTYTKYRGGLLEALNLEGLLESLADFLLQSGFAGGPQYHPWWGLTGDDPDHSLDGLKQKLLEALIQTGQLTPDMLAELRGEGDNEDAREALAQLLDDLVERLVDEGYLEVGGGAPAMPSSFRPLDAEGHVDEAARAARQVEFSLTAKGLDFLAYRTLREIISALGRSSQGSHETPHLDTGIEANAASRPYAFGDSLNLDIPATLGNAIRRSGPALPLDLDYPDLMVHQAEYRSSCATVLMLDVSHSMILYGEDRFTPAKKVALALSHLIRTQFPGDTLKVITFGDRAEEIPLARLGKAQVGPFHTNTAEGLQLARRLLRAQGKDMQQIIMITDGKPSAITLPGGRVYKNPAGLDPRVLKETFREVAACRKSNVIINTFMLARDPALVAFVSRVCELARGRAYFTSTMTLGQYLMRDFLRGKTRRG